MSKMLETKKKIFNLLKHRNMTITELSKELNLSTATVSQHLDELQNAGAIEKIDNEHFKKMKYYKAKEMTNQPIAKYIVGGIIVVALVAVFLAYGVGGGAKPTYGNNASPSTATTGTNSVSSNTATNTTNSTRPGIGGGAFACPMITYNLNGSITGFSGFKLYYVNSSSGGTVADYVIAPGTSGHFNITENVTSILSEPGNNTQFTQNRTHYVGISDLNRSIGSTPQGINATIMPQNFNVTGVGEKLYSTVSVNVTSNANLTSYWMRVDGPCGGGVSPVVITIGSAPYSGNVPISVVTYA